MTTRRAVLAAAVGIAAATAGPLTSAAGAAAPAGPTIPRTLARPAGRLGTSVRSTQTSFPLSHLAVGWSGAGEPGVRVRTAPGWGDWQAVGACQGGRDGVDPRQRWAMLTVPGAVGYEIVHSDPTSSLSVTELNTVDGPARATAAPVSATLRIGDRPAPARFYSRAASGADESLRFATDGTENWPPAYFAVQTLTVHHTAGINADPNPAATVRAIYYYHAITQGWGDVGYHLLIDEAGSVYEGRWSGDDPVPVFGSTLGSDGRPQMVNAAHVGGFNAGNIGISLLGNFTNQLPTPAARRALTVVLAALSAVEGLDPVGITNYVNPVSGATRTGDTISGHRDWAATECPGNLFYPQVPSLRQDVNHLLVS